MNSAQALELFIQVINQTKFLPHEYEAIKQAFGVLNDLVQKDISSKSEIVEDGNKDK